MRPAVFRLWLQRPNPGPSAILAARNGPVALDYRKIRIATDEWQASFRDGLRERAAAAVSQRIDTLLEESKAADPKKSLYPFRLKELAKVLATLDPHGSKDRILDILAASAQYDGWRRVALLERLIFAGVAPSTEPILAALDPVIAELRRHGVHNDNASLFGHVLCVLPFLDPPARGIERIRELLSEFHIPLYAQRELLMAISQCRDEGRVVVPSRYGSRQCRSISTDWPRMAGRRCGLSVATREDGPATVYRSGN